MAIIRKVKRNMRASLESLQYMIDRKLGCVYWLHIGDLLTPCDGNVTGGQMFVASRVLDIKRIQNGEYPIWQNKLHDYVYQPMDQEASDRANLKFVRLVHSLNKRGLNPNIEKLSITDAPICLNNGTHRIAYMVLENPNAFLPFERKEKDLKPWFPINGKSYWMEHGMPETECQQLLEEYERILTQYVRVVLSGYVRSEYYNLFEEVSSQYGCIIRKQRVEIDKDAYVVFQWKLRKQSLYTARRQLRSIYVDSVIGDMNRITGRNEWGGVAHTVTESIEIENSIENEAEVILDWCEEQNYKGEK